MGRKAKTSIKKCPKCKIEKQRYIDYSISCGWCRVCMSARNSSKNPNYRHSGHSIDVQRIVCYIADIAANEAGRT